MPAVPVWSDVAPEMVVLKGSSASCWGWLCCRCRVAGAFARSWRRALTVLADEDFARPLVGADDGTPCRPLVLPRAVVPAFFLAGTAFAAFLGLALALLVAAVFLVGVFLAAVLLAALLLPVLLVAVLLAVLLVAVAAFPALVRAGAFLAVVLALVFVALLLVGLDLALLVLVGRAGADPARVVFLATALLSAGSALRAVFRAGEVALPAAAFADAAERPAMATALCPRSGLPLRSAAVLPIDPASREVRQRIGELDKSCTSNTHLGSDERRRWRPGPTPRLRR